MFAVIKTGGKQYRVAAEDVIRIDRVNGQPGEIVEFGEVLVVGGDTPQLEEAPPQEFATQARLPPRVFGDPHYRNPHRRRQAIENGGTPAQAGAETPGGSGRCSGNRSQNRRGKSQNAGKSGRKKARQAGYKKQEEVR
jgi:large subunit ribosomal protein L21